MTEVDPLALPMHTFVHMTPQVAFEWNPAKAASNENAFDRVLVVVYTWRGADIRLISARKANRREQAEYER